MLGYFGTRNNRGSVCRSTLTPPAPLLALPHASLWTPSLLHQFPDLPGFGEHITRSLGLARTFRVQGAYPFGGQLILSGLCISPLAAARAATRAGTAIQSLRLFPRRFGPRCGFLRGVRPPLPDTAEPCSFSIAYAGNFAILDRLEPAWVFRVLSPVNHGGGCAIEIPRTSRVPVQSRAQLDS